MDCYNTFAKRFWAGVVDSLVFLPFQFLDLYLFDPKRSELVLIGWGVVSYSIYWLYSVTMHARYGQTLGKMATGVKVLDLSEERIPSLRQAVFRDIGYIVLNIFGFAYFVYLVLSHTYATHQTTGGSILDWIIGFAGLGWFLLEVATMLTNSKRRALHDYIGGTVVLRLDSKS